MNSDHTVTATFTAVAVTSTPVTATSTPVTATSTGVLSPALGPECTLAVTSKRVLVPYGRTRKRHKGAIKPGSIGVTVACDQTVAVAVTGTLFEEIPQTGRTNHQVHKSFPLQTVHLAIAAHAVTLMIKLPSAAVTALMHGAREAVMLALIATNPNGTNQAKATIGQLRVRH